MCNANNYHELMQEYVKQARIEKQAKEEKEKVKTELIQYMKTLKEYEPGKWKTESVDGLKAMYTEFTTESIDTAKATAYVKKIPALYNRFKKVTEKTRFTCS